MAQVPLRASQGDLTLSGALRRLERECMEKHPWQKTHCVQRLDPEHKLEVEWGEKRQEELEKGCGRPFSAWSSQTRRASENWSTMQGPRQRCKVAGFVCFQEIALWVAPPKMMSESLEAVNMFPYMAKWTSQIQLS